VTHLDADRLTLLALGEAVSGVGHLSHCNVCLLRLTRLHEVAAIAAHRETLEEPPEQVWVAVQSVLEGEEQTASGSRWRGGLLWGLAGAASVIAVALIGASVLAAVDRPDAQPLAIGELEPLAASTGGQVRLLEADEGFALEVDVGDLPELTEGYYEVWLLDPEITGLISLGPLPAGGHVALPLGLDIRAFPVVDVSIEHFDGDPTHSGDSVLRGELSRASPAVTDDRV
jgi:anti-sigma-K factor RskA